MRLSWCQRSRTRFQIARALVVRMYLHLLWSSKRMEPLLQS